jgi:hypothetical protein
MTSYVQKFIDGEWKLVEKGLHVTNTPRLTIIHDIEPYVANATREPTLITSRSSERKYMANNNLHHFEPGHYQDVAQNRKESEMASRKHLRDTLIQQLNRERL